MKGFRPRLLCGPVLVASLFVTTGLVSSHDSASDGASARREALVAAAFGARAAAAGAQLIEASDYDGVFTLIRIRYGSGGGSLRGFGRRGGGAPWAHDWPYAEVNFTKILAATTLVGPYLDQAGKYTALDDPEFFKYPLAYLVEPGGWFPSEPEVEGLRNFLLKGGFLIVDDFRGSYEFQNLQQQLRRALPDAVIVELEDTHEIFDSFFRIEDPKALTPPYGGYPPLYAGIFEDNDPTKRLMVVINVNNDHMEYWEYSDHGFYPIDLANEAYKFGVNYVIYGMTH